jgi:hypothetical protein
VAAEQDLAAAGERRHSCRQVDRSAEVVSAALDGRTVVETDTHGRNAVVVAQVVRDSQPEVHRVARRRDAEHQRVTDRLDVLASNGR